MRTAGIVALMISGAVALSGCHSDETVVPVSMPPPIAPTKTKEKLVDVMGIKDPVTCASDRVEIADKAIVVGVVVGDQARAYLLKALEMPEDTFVNPGIDDEGRRLLARHVVNDRLNGVPISVTYCDANSCKQVFSSTQEDSLELRVGGTRDDKMLLRYKDATFAQDAESVPLDRYPFEVTSWREWLAKHPHTDIYLGDFRELMYREEKAGE